MENKRGLLIAMEYQKMLKSLSSFFIIFFLFVFYSFAYSQPLGLGRTATDNEVASCDIDIRPEAMNISWDDVDTCLKTLKDFVIENNLWYGISNDFDYSKNIFLELKENVENIYK